MNDQNIAAQTKIEGMGAVLQPKGVHFRVFLLPAILVTGNTIRTNWCTKITATGPVL